MTLNRITNRYPVALCRAIKRIFVVALRDGCEASSITTALMVASATKALPATMSAIFDIDFHLSTAGRPPELNLYLIQQGRYAVIASNGSRHLYLSEAEFF